MTTAPEDPTPRNGGLTRKVAAVVMTYGAVFGAGWYGCWSLHDKIDAPAGARDPTIPDSAIGQDQAPTFWQMQTTNFARLGDEHEHLRSGQLQILQALARIEARLRD